jgi:Protein of unknown function (DUF2971)
MSSDTARIVLQERTLRWSSPHLFNDPFDIQFDLNLNYDPEEVIEKALAKQWDGYVGEVDLTSGNPLGRQLMQLRDKIKGISRERFIEFMRPAVRESLDVALATLPQFQEAYRAHLTGIKILCLSETNVSILMWSHYAQNHTGVVIRLSCIEELDSAWGAARKVRYTDDMPSLCDQDAFIRFIGGESAIDKVEAFARSVLTKAVEWKYEREWRMISGRDRKARFEDIPYDARQVTAVYFGCKMPEQTRSELLEVVRKNFQHAELFDGRKSDREFKLLFRSVS